jgi:DNA polymerase-3 subunit alpha
VILFKNKEFAKYLVERIKVKIEKGAKINTKLAFEEIIEMSKHDGMLQELYSLMKNKVRGEKNEVNSYLAYVFKVTSKKPEGPFKPRLRFDYMIEKYGRSETANIGTYQRFKAKKAIRTAIKVMDPCDDKDKSFELENEVANFIPDSLNMTIPRALKESPELSSYQKKYPDIFDVALAIEGLCSGPSFHPAGIVIADQPIGNLAPLHILKKGTFSTQFEMVELEDIGLIKFDILSLKTLSAFSMTLKDIYKDLDIDIDLNDIPLDDPDALAIFSKGKTDTVFQMESYGMKKLLKDIRVDSFHDIAASNALYRPGALAAGAHEDYCACKHGNKSITYVHPVLEHILENSYGQMIYQEQAMMIAIEFAGFTIKEADMLRKAIGKKKGDMFIKLKKKFIEGAIKKSKVSKEEAGKIWQNIEYQGGYAFNQSHSYAYAVLAMQCAYLKAHYPVQHMKGVINAEIMDGVLDKADRYLKESLSMKIKVYPVNIQKSKALVSIERENLRNGFASIKGVGMKAAKEIEEIGPYVDFEDFIKRTRKTKVINKSVVETLVKAGVFAEFDIHGEKGVKEYMDIREHYSYMEKHNIQENTMFD